MNLFRGRPAWQLWLGGLCAVLYVVVFVYALMAPLPPFIILEAPQEPALEALARQTIVLPTSIPTSVPHQQTRSRLNLNQADAWMLEAVPGIGAGLAERIIQYRDLQGGFVAVEELLRVQGIGEKTYEAMLGYVMVGE